MKTEIFLIRHGQSETNLTEVFTGSVDAPLTDLGKRQAKKSAEYLKEKKIDVIFSSSLKRAIETAKAFSEMWGIPIIEEKGFNEIFFGDWSGITYSEARERNPKEYDAFKNDIGSFKAPGGESAEELFKRVSEAFARILKENEGKKILIITHGIVIKALLTLSIGKGLKDMQKEAVLTNGSITFIEKEEDRFNILFKGLDEHLMELKTEAPKL